jgi:hypothetical protein
MPKAAASASPLPLAGIRVLDLASYIAAPVAAAVLADYGADVVKVEPPGRGDPNRMMHTLATYPQHEVNDPWHLGARQTLARHRPEGRGGARGALPADRPSGCVHHQLPLKVRERLKLDHATVAALNRRLI